MYDPANKRYEVPIDRPVLNSSHYGGYINVELKREPFAMTVAVGQDIM